MKMVEPEYSDFVKQCVKEGTYVLKEYELRLGVANVPLPLRIWFRMIGELGETKMKTCNVCGKEVIDDKYIYIEEVDDVYCQKCYGEALIGSKKE